MNKKSCGTIHLKNFFVSNPTKKPFTTLPLQKRKILTTKTANIVISVASESGNPVTPKLAREISRRTGVPQQEIINALRDKGHKI